METALAGMVQLQQFVSVLVVMYTVVVVCPSPLSQLGANPPAEIVSRLNLIYTRVPHMASCIVTRLCLPCLTAGTHWPPCLGGFFVGGGGLHNVHTAHTACTFQGNVREFKTFQKNVSILGQVGMHTTEHSPWDIGLAPSFLPSWIGSCERRCPCCRQSERLPRCTASGLLLGCSAMAFCACLLSSW